MDLFDSTVYKGQYIVEVMYNGRHVTGSPFHQEIFDPREVKLESAKTSGFVGDEMGLNSTCIYISLVTHRNHEFANCFEL